MVWIFRVIPTRPAPPIFWSPPMWFEDFNIWDEFKNTVRFDSFNIRHEFNTCSTSTTHILVAPHVIWWFEYLGWIQKKTWDLMVLIFWMNSTVPHFFFLKKQNHRNSFFWVKNKITKARRILKSSPKAGHPKSNFAPGHPVYHSLLSD